MSMSFPSKGEMMISQVAKLILGLIGLALFIIFVGMMVWPSVKALLGLTDEAMFDDKLVERYSESLIEDKEARDSVVSLLYSVNRLAWFDTHYARSWSGEINIGEELGREYYATSASGTKSVGSFASFERTYGTTKVVPTILDMEVVYYTGEKDHVLKVLLKNVLDCFYMYKDLGDANVRCFAADFGEIGDVEITKSDIKPGFDLLKADRDMCDESCQDKIDDVAGFGYFNPDDWSFDVAGGVITDENTVNEPNSLVRICAETGGDGSGGFGDSWGDFWTKDLIYITTDIDKCRTPVDSMKFGLIIKDFNLPDRLGPSYQVEGGLLKFLANGYGDPKYVVYYEKFPPGEDAAWSASAIDFDDLFTFAGAELACHMVLTPAIKLMGRVAPPVGTAVSAFMSAIGVDRYACILFSTVVTRTRELYLDKGDDIMWAEVGLIDWGVDILNAVIEKVKELVEEVKARVTGDYINRLGVERHPEKINNYIVLKHSGREFIRNYYNTIAETISKEEDFSRHKEKYIGAFNETMDMFQGRDVIRDGKLTQEFQDSLFLAFQSVPEVPEKLDAIPELLLSNINDFVEGSMFQYNWFFTAARDTNDELARLLDDEDRETKIRSYFKENTKINGLNAKDKRELLRKLDLVLMMALEEQETSPSVRDSFGPDIEASFSMLKGSIPDADFTMSAKDTGTASQTRALVTKEAVLFRIMLMNVQDKFRFLGTNSFGLRTPYKATIPMDDRHTRLWDWPDDKDLYLDYFDHFGGYDPETGVASQDNRFFSERYLGVLPEVERYYIALKRDQASYWWAKAPLVDWNDVLFSQPNIRFHLVSPCKADLVMHVTNCQCFGKPTDKSAASLVPSGVRKLFGVHDMYQTGDYNELYGTSVPHFDGTNSMLYTIDEATGQLVKECPAKNVANYLPWNNEPRYTPRCIEINPVMDKETNPNYCYRGYEPPYFQAAHFLFNWGAPIMGAGVGVTVDLITLGGTLGTGAATGFTAAGTAGALIDMFVIDTFEALCYRWPKHGGTAEPCT